MKANLMLINLKELDIPDAVCLQILTEKGDKLIFERTLSFYLFNYFV